MDNKLAVKLGFIGYGEAAYCMSRGLCNEGLNNMKAFDVALCTDNPYKETVEQRLKSVTGIIKCTSASEVLHDCNIVVIAVPAKFTESTAEALLPYVQKGQLFADVTTALPDVKNRLSKKFQEHGADYVDSAMLGALAVSGHKVPILASGNGAQRWCDAMTPWGMRIKVFGAEVGDASRMKLVRSVFMKGLEALIVESLAFAHKCHLEEQFIQSVSKDMNEEKFEDLIYEFASSDLLHSERRGFELGKAMELMKAEDMVPLVAAGAKARMEKTTQYGFKEQLQGKCPDTLSEVYQLFDSKNYL